MSINTHLQATASALLIAPSERGVIDGHITALKNKLASHFTTGTISEHFAFGSYMRKTLMPRRADGRSDVDFMIVFSNATSTYQPNTYLNRLRTFANEKYSRSEIYTDHPTIVLELSRIKIELVPAIKNTYDDYQIPAPASDYASWLTTHPTAFGTKVTVKNQAEKKMIRPMIRLFKYWNALNGYVFSSYTLENLIVNHYYSSASTLWDYVYSFVDGLGTFGYSDANTRKINALKNACLIARNFELGTYFNVANSILAEAEIKKAFPTY